MNCRPICRINYRAAAFFLWVSCATHAYGSERLITGLTLQNMSGADGGTLSVDWVNGLDNGVRSLGLERTVVGGSRWTLVKAGGTRNLNDRWKLTGDINVGPAVMDAGSSIYRKLSAGLLYHLSSRLTLSTQDMYVDVEPVSGHIVSGGALVIRDNGLSFNVQLSHSISGNIDDRSISARIDYRATPPYLMAGVVFGKSNNHLLLNLPVADATETELRQGFLGVSFPMKSRELTLIINAAKVGDVDRLALSAVLSQPVNWLD